MKKGELVALKTALSAACSAKAVLEDIEKGKKSTIRMVSEQVVPVISSPFFYFMLLAVFVIAFALGYTFKDLIKRK